MFDFTTDGRIYLIVKDRFVYLGLFYFKSMKRLKDIGFIQVGQWKIDEGIIKYDINSHHNAKNILYCFISNGIIKYIGKTKGTLIKRLRGYQNPVVSQTTNIRVNELIKNSIENNNSIDILILVDNSLLNYGNFKINLAAGLEDTLIYEINPDWNLSGKKSLPVDIESEKQKLSENPKSISSLISIVATFQISLGKAYYNQGFFNVKQKYSNLFGDDKEQIHIQLGIDTDKIIQGSINRTANKNGTPRIMGRRELTSWIKSNFNPNDIIKVDIISSNSIRLYK